MEQDNPEIPARLSQIEMRDAPPTLWPGLVSLLESCTEEQLATVLGCRSEKLSFLRSSLCDVTPKAVKLALLREWYLKENSTALVLHALLKDIDCHEGAKLLVQELQGTYSCNIINFSLSVRKIKIQ